MGHKWGASHRGYDRASAVYRTAGARTGREFGGQLRSGLLVLAACHYSTMLNTAWYWTTPDFPRRAAGCSSSAMNASSGASCS